MYSPENLPPSSVPHRATTPGAEWDAAQLEQFVRSFATAGLQLDGLMIWQRNEVIHEQYWWPAAANLPHMLHSATKSVTGTAAGFALAEGHLGLDDLVVDILPDKLPHTVSDNLSQMRVRDVLTMRTGHAQGLSGSNTRHLHGDLVAHLLSQPVDLTPGTAFVYSSATSHLLSAIVQRSVGAPIGDYLGARLFEPLRIDPHPWDQDPNGVQTGGNGLRLRLQDLLKWGVLHLQDGMWNGSRVLPAGWVTAATTPHVTEVTDSVWDGQAFVPVALEDTEDVEHFGYHMWLKPEGLWMAAGLFGQYVFIHPALDTVVAITGSIGQWRHRELPKHVLRHFALANGLQRGAENNSLARARLEHDRTISAAPWKIEPTHTAIPQSIFGDFRARSGTAETGVTNIRIEDRGESVGFCLQSNGSWERVEAGRNKWVEQRTSIGGERIHHSYALDGEPTLARITAITPDAIEFKVLYPQTPFRDTWRITATTSGITVSRHSNVNSGPLAWPLLEADRAQHRTSPLGWQGQ